MRALLVERLGPPDTHRVVDREPPQPCEGEVLVDVRAAALNYPDLLVMAGQYQVRPELPFIPGAEGAGVVAGLGKGAERFKIGDEVTFITVTGAFAEQVVVPETSLTPKAPRLSFAAAAGFGLTYATSYYALKQRAQIQPGESLLVLGAAGGVGSAAVELGKCLGANVTAAVGSAAKSAFVTELGADQVVVYGGDDLREQLRAVSGGRGFDVVYDPVGGALAEPSLRSTAWGGRYLVVGFAAGEIPSIPLNLPLLKGSAVVGVFWGAWAERDPAGNRRNFNELLSMVAAGDIAPRVSAVYPLDEVAAAYDEIQQRRVFGKIILDLEGK